MRVGMERMLAATMSMTALGLRFWPLSANAPFLWRAAVLALLGRSACRRLIIGSVDAIMINARRTVPGWRNPSDQLPEAGWHAGGRHTWQLVAAIWLR